MAAVHHPIDRATLNAHTADEAVKLAFNTLFCMEVVAMNRIHHRLSNRGFWDHVIACRAFAENTAQSHWSPTHPDFLVPGACDPVDIEKMRRALRAWVENGSVVTAQFPKGVLQHKESTVSEAERIAAMEQRLQVVEAQYQELRATIGSLLGEDQRVKASTAVFESHYGPLDVDEVDPNSVTVDEEEREWLLSIDTEDD